MNKNKKRTGVLNTTKAATLTAILGLCLTTASWAAQKTVSITGLPAATATALQTAFGTPVSGDTVTVTGTFNPTTAQSITIPAGVYVIWKASISTATQSIQMFTVNGDGTFELADGGIISYNRNDTYYPLIVNGNVKLILNGGTLYSQRNDANYMLMTTATNAIVVNSGNYTGDYRRVSIGACKSFEINGGSIYGIGSNTTAGCVYNFNGGTVGTSIIYIYSSGGVYNINGGTIYGFYSQSSDNVTININGGTVTSGVNFNNIATNKVIVKGGVTGAISSLESVDIQGGRVTGTVSSSKDISVSGNAEIDGVPSAGAGALMADGNVNIKDKATVFVNSGNAISVTGQKSKVTLEGNCSVSGGGSASGISGNGSDVAVEVKGQAKMDFTSGSAIFLSGTNSKVTVSGGEIKTTSGTAIYTHGDKSVVTVSGGRVEATTGLAISNTGNGSSSNITGGTVFAYGSQIRGLRNVIDSPNFTEPTGTGTVIAFDAEKSARSYLRGDALDIVKLPLTAAASWDKGDHSDGIDYANGANTGFIEVPEVAVNKRAAAMANLTFAIPAGKVYNGTAQGIGNVTGASGVGTITVKYNGVTSTPVNAGSYLVSADVAEGDYYGSAMGVALGTYVIGKANGVAVAAPSAENRTQTSVKINPVLTPISGQSIEYSYSTIETAPAEGWQTGLTFGDLSQNTIYYFFARSQENGNYKTGTASSTAIRTLDDGGYGGPTFAVSVNSGTANKTVAAQGDAVAITAATAPAGKVFDKWTSNDGVIFANATSASTTFAMLAKAVTVTATFKNLPVNEYVITVQNDGTGTANTSANSAAAGTTITLTATAGAGYVFDAWEVVNGGITLDNASAIMTAFNMPANAVTVKATFKSDGKTSIFKNADKGDANSGIKALQGGIVSNIVSQTADISVTLPNGERVSEVKVVVYDNIGNVVFERSEHGNSVTWNLTNNAGRNVANGSYLVVAEAKNVKGVAKMYSKKLGVKR
ncbi:MAG: MBG domain-containing protein [Chitinispirillales bacterium]|jgi:hypothetical protein|nr:MBG domain-containing protein [Chitinispirillales bacterium]